MNRELPAIAKQAARVLAAVDDAVRRFNRAHKYQVGADLRRDAMQVSRYVSMAWHDRGRQLQCVHDLAGAIDCLKISMMLGKDVGAFRSFGEFEALVRLISDLGKQCGGWQKALQSKGQNGQGNPPGQRAPILSSRTACKGQHYDEAPLP
jgi:hypothetical protein